jgi:hypothetical protein
MQAASRDNARNPTGSIRNVGISIFAQHPTANTLQERLVGEKM